MQSVTLALNAMNTRFEMVLHGENVRGLRAAGEEALREVERLESVLSVFRPTSEIALLNSRASNAPVHVSPEVFSLLQHALELSVLTEGAFDITVGPLVRCWGFWDGKGRTPDPEEVAKAHTCVGADLVRLNSDNDTVKFARPGVLVDLGGIGKGYAVDRAAEILRDVGV